MSSSSDEEKWPRSQRKWMRIHAERKKRVSRVLFEAVPKMIKEVSFSKNIDIVDPADTSCGIQFGNTKKKRIHCNDNLAPMNTQPEEKTEETKVLSEQEEEVLRKTEMTEKANSAAAVANLSHEDFGCNIDIEYDDTGVYYHEELEDHDINSIVQDVMMEMEEADCYAISILFNFCTTCKQNLCIWYGQGYNAEAHTFALENPFGRKCSSLVPSEV